VYATVALGALLAVAGPQLVGRAFTLGLRGAVADAGPRAEITVEVPVPQPITTPAGEPGYATVAPADLAVAADAFHRSLPAVVGKAAGPLVTSVSSDPMTVTGAAAGRPPTELTIAYVDGGGGTVHYRSGVAPKDAGLRPAAGVVPVAVPAPLADALHLQPGSRVVARSSVSLPTTLVVTGVFTVDDPAAPAWRVLPHVPAPRVADGRISGTVLVDSETLVLAEKAAVRGAGNPLQASIRHLPAAGGLVAADLEPLRRAVRTLPPIDAPVSWLTDVVPQTGLVAVLDEYALKEHAARAQLSLVVVGVVGAAAVVVLLGVRLLVARRAGTLALEHARGASVTAIIARVAVETVPLGVLASLLGAVVAVYALPGTDGARRLLPSVALGDVLPPLAVVVVTAALGPALLSGWTAWRSWARRQVPANRSARNRLRGSRTLRRTVVEAFVLVLAAAAAFALRGRGLIQSQTGNVDLLLAAAPLLLVAAVGLVVVRVYPWPVRGLAAVARRRSGVVGTVSTARARTAVTVLPLLGIAVSVALVMTAGLIRDTVTGGLESASWERTGADARVQTTLPDDAGAVMRRAPGVTAVAAGHLRRAVDAKLGNEYVDVTVIAVDGTELGRLLGARGRGYRGELDRLGARGADGALPVVVDATLAERVLGRQPTLTLADAYLPTRIVGTASVPPAGWVEGYVVYADRAALGAVAKEFRSTNLLLADGPRAAEAARALPSVASDEVSSRADWLAANRDSDLLAQIVQLFGLAVAALAAFAAIALLTTVLGSARERARALSTLRTLGLTAAQGRWLTLGELAPLVVAGAAAGALSGLLVVPLLGPTLGLVELTGGLGAPPLRLDPRFVAGVLGGLLVLLIGTALAEVAVHRKDRLAEVLRVGDAR
jgi:putative ABC transport system permease protein